MFALLRQRNFALLWLGGLISILGDRVLAVALPYYVYQQSGSTLATATMVAAKLIPSLLFSSGAGVFADRWDRKKIMLVTSLAQAPVLLPLLWVTSADTLWIVYLVAFFQTVIAVFFAPAENALLPRLVGADQLVFANTLNRLNDNLARLIGPLVGGVILTYTGLSGVVLFDSLTFLIAGLLILLVRPPAGVTLPPATRPAATAPASTHLWRKAILWWRRFLQEWKEGIQVIRRDRVVSVLFIAFVLLNFGGVMLDPLNAPFLIDVVRVDSQTYGLLLTIQAVGGISGALAAGKIGQRLSPARVFGWGTMLVGLLQLTRYNLPTLPVVVTMTLLIGLPAAVVGIAMDTLFQQNVPNSHLGRVSGMLITTISVVSLFGVLGIAGALGDVLGIVPLLNFAAVVTISAGLVGVLFLPVRKPSNEEI